MTATDVRSAGAGAAAQATPESGALVLVIAAVASGASALLAVASVDGWGRVAVHPLAFAGFVAVALMLQFVVVELYGRGAVSFANTGLLAVGFMFGPAPAMAAGIAAALARFVVARGRVYRAIFDAASLALAAGLGSAIYTVPREHGFATSGRLGVAFVAGAVYFAVNVGLLSVAMSIAEGSSALAVWRERFRWMTPYSLAAGPLALVLIVAYEKLGLTGLFAFALPPAFMTVSMRQYLTRTKEAVEETRATNEDLRTANIALAARNEDLHRLLGFAGGLAATAADRSSLVAYAEQSISHLTGGRARIRIGRGDGGIPLVAGGMQVGSLSLLDGVGFDRERWERLRGAVVPQLATAIEGVELVEKIRKTHVATIAALSRSMEAKDYYTGGHTERVAAISVALARRLGYDGADLDAIEVGALLHDIGKIGIPETILHKPGPLDEAEWKVMKEHPVISDYILSEVDLPPVVRHIARSSHERIDGGGYPDGLAGDAIPLPARIILVADAFDAITSDRPYRRARDTASALEELRRNAGTQFCPLVVEALEHVHGQEPHVLTPDTVLRPIAVA